MNLDELSVKYGTDKGSLKHNYMLFYEQHLPKNPKKLLEIGILDGASIRMWREWFPDCEIHGLDLFEENTAPEIEGVIWHKGHQCDYILLDSLRNENFDIIIDDGSHGSRDQMITFFGLFNGSQYYIEDTHCNLNEFYSQGLPKSFTAFETFIYLNGERPGIKEKVNVTYGENIIMVNTITDLR